MAQDQTPAGAPAPAAAASAPKRPARGDHTYLDSAGAVVENIELATGVGYKDLATGENFVYQIPDAVAGTVATMYGIFGAKTRCTNAASAARQKRERDSTYIQSDVAYVMEVFGETKPNQWAIEGEGTRAPAYDLEVLADVVTELATKDSGKQQDRAKILAKLQTDLKWRRGAIGDSSVKLEYLSRMAAKTPAAGAQNASRFALD